jgi:hypothetical protein
MFYQKSLITRNHLSTYLLPPISAYFLIGGFVVKISIQTNQMPAKDTCNGWLENSINSSNFCDLISLPTVESPFSETFLAEPWGRVRGWQWWRILFLRDFECPGRGDGMNFLALLSHINSTHFTSANGQHGAVWPQLFFSSIGSFRKLANEVSDFCPPYY